MASLAFDHAGMTDAQAEQEPLRVGLGQGELRASVAKGSRTQMLAMPVAITMRLVADSSTAALANGSR